MNILQICPGAYQSAWGGVSEHVINISERLAERHNVTVFATNPRGILPWSETIRGVKIRRFRRFAPNGSYQFSLDMLMNLRKARFDIVHSHGYHGLPLHYSWIAKYHKLVMSTHFHGVGHSTFRNCSMRLFKPIGRFSLKKANVIIAVSEFEKNLLCRYFGLDPSKVHVIPNGVNIKEFEDIRYTSENIKDNFKSLLYVGRLESYKGVGYLVEVLPKLKSNTQLVIVGVGSMRNYLEKRATELNVVNRTHFLDNVSREQLLNLHFQADLFLLLSEHEAYSLSVADALASGTPCIVGDSSALREWVDNRSCFGIDLPINLNKLADLIEDALQVRRSEVMHEFKQKWFGAKILDWSDIVENLERVYSSL